MRYNIYLLSNLYVIFLYTHTSLHLYIVCISIQKYHIHFLKLKWIYYSLIQCNGSSDFLCSSFVPLLRLILCVTCTTLTRENTVNYGCACINHQNTKCDTLCGTFNVNYTHNALYDILNATCTLLYCKGRIMQKSKLIWNYYPFLLTILLISNLKGTIIDISRIYAMRLTNINKIN